MSSSAAKPFYAIACAVLLAAGLSALAGAAEPAPLLSVAGVAESDVLNLRAEPDARSRIVGRLAANTSDIAVVGQATASLDWIMVESGRLRGWANTRYLAYGGPPQQGRLPVRLRCAGTEPFRGIDVGYGRAEVNLAFDASQRRMVLATPIPAAARPRIWLLPSARSEDPASFLLIEGRTCSDGMSDRAYPFTVAARVGETLLSGCCR
jgi:uncharacterized membrane protein